MEGDKLEEPAFQVEQELIDLLFYDIILSGCIHGQFNSVLECILSNKSFRSSLLS